MTKIYCGLPEERRRIREKVEHHFVKAPMKSLQRDLLFIVQKGKPALRRLSRLYPGTRNLVVSKSLER